MCQLVAHCTNFALLGKKAFSLMKKEEEKV